MQFIPPAAESQQFDHNCRYGGNCYLTHIPAWDAINDTLPGKIRITDVDGMVEMGGRFVFFEHKRARGRHADGELGGGQRLALARLSKLPGILVVILMSPAPADAGIVDVFARFYMAGQPSRIDGTYSDKFEPYERGDIIDVVHRHLGIRSGAHA